MLRKTLRFAILAAVASAAIAANPADDAERAFSEFIEASRLNDLARLEKLTSPQFVQHHGYGLVEPRAALLIQKAPATGVAMGTDFLERAMDMRVIGPTAIRTSIVRIRRPARKLDTWVRSIAVMTNVDEGWQVAELNSALLYEGPITDVVVTKLPSDQFTSKEGGAFRLVLRGDHPFLDWADGRSLPLIPLAPDLFVSGYGSTLTIERGADGAAVAAVRKYGERIAWRATPAGTRD